MIIPVDLDERSYNVCIDEEDSFADKLKEMFPHSKFVLVTNRTLERLHESAIAEWENDIPLLRYVIEDGERYKTLDTLKGILDFLLESRLDRDTVIIALGGGVVGDIAGFAASVFLRGIAYIQVPTTLLAMVDSSVGGKTAVNHVMGKNLIGTFHQPKMVWINTQVLETLPDREFNAGYAEVFKYAFIGGRDMFDFIVTNHEDIIAREKASLEEAIKRSIEIKAHIVSEDEHESGKRTLLNFGHTFGHALERFYQYNGILHGEGICWGIKCAVDLAKRIDTVSAQDYDSFDLILEKLLLLKLPSKPDVANLYESMFSDKKVRAGKLRFVLPTEPGMAVIKEDVPEKDIVATLERVFNK